MLDLIGQLIDRYQVIAHMSDERWGSVFKAYDPKFDRTVVLQILDRQWAVQEDIEDYVYQTALAMLRWRDPGFARILDVGRTSEAIGDLPAPVLYIVREYLPGENLRQLLDDLRSRGQWIMLGEALQLVRHICLAIDYAHQRGLLHGNLSPENIRFKSEATEDLPYQPALINLGFVKPGALAGSLPPTAYRIPEAGQGGRVSKTSDIYAVGVLLYELVTSQVPIGQTPTQPLTQDQTGIPEAGAPTKIVAGAVLPPRMLRSDIPIALDQAILKAIDPDPAARFSDLRTLAATLANLTPQVAMVLSAPPSLQQAIGLSEAYQRSLTAEADQLSGGPEVSTSIPKVDISRDQIHILLPDQAVQSVTVKPGGMTIGRAADNEIVIDQPGVSRRHARIEFDGFNYQVRDLNSTNGTFLEDRKLEPNSPEIWLVGENLRVGEVWLRLERAGQTSTTRAVVSGRGAAPGEHRPTDIDQSSIPTQPGKGLPQTEAMFFAPDGSTIDNSQVLISPGAGWVGVYCESNNLSVTPGASTTATLVLFNRGPSPDIFDITLQGIPPDWIATPPRPVNMLPSSQREVQITFRPPRSSAGRAGRHTVTVRVASQNGPSQVVEARLALTVTAFSQFFSELLPKQVQSGEVGQVVIHNRGNMPETFTTLLEDRLHELVFEPPQVKVSVPPGKSAAVEFRPGLLTPRWFGGDQTHDFKAHVSAQTGQMQSHSGQYISQGLIPTWAPIGLSALCVILACVALLLYYQVTAPVRASRQTAEAGQTALALSGGQTAVAGTATVTSLASANLATQQAATTTAAWANADPDNDGLTNTQEAAAGTNPNNPDTDGDGLKDGEEVNLWKTNPLLADTDGDGWNDDREIEEGTNPLDPDTDHDGLIDSIDPDPLHPPTKTPVSFFTPRPTSTPWIFFTPRPTATSIPFFTPTPPVAVADLSISISNAQNSSIPGTEITYTILVTNHGPSAVTGAQVIDTLAGVLSGVTWNCTASFGSSCSTPNGVGNINALVNLAMNGTATLNATGYISPEATGSLSNTAMVAPPAGVLEPNTLNNQDTDTDALTPRVSLSVTKTDNHSQIEPGQNDTYVIVVSNSGPSAVEGVTVLDNFPSDLVNVQWSCSASQGSRCARNNPQSGNINTQVNLLPGGSATFNTSGTVRNTASGTLSNTVSLVSPIDPLTNNKSASDDTVIIAQADLLVEVSAPLTTTVSSQITYTIGITNNGPGIGTELELTTLFPLGVPVITYTVSTPAQWGSSPCTITPAKLICNFGSLDAGETITVQIVITVPSTPGTLTTVVDIKASETDPDPTNNTVTNNVEVY
jgi:uncharacterized repeat protein (TIGR01451 family)